MGDKDLKDMGIHKVHVGCSQFLQSTLSRMICPFTGTEKEDSSSSVTSFQMRTTIAAKIYCLHLGEYLLHL
nr:hypothetical protein CFP56_73609 [Quercus suber]